MGSVRVFFLLFALLATVYGSSSVVLADRVNNDVYYGESIRSQDLEYGLVDNDALIFMAEHNLTDANEIFKIDFVAVTEVFTNGSAARDPIPLEGGSWNYEGAEFQDNGGVFVIYYSQTILLESREIELDIVLAIANNRTTFFTLFGNHTLEKDDLKVGILVNDWPFMWPSNNLNITMNAWSDRYNNTKIERDDDNVEYSEFGNIDDDDYKVLHINFEHSCILDGNKANNVTVWQDDDEHTIYVTLPHHEQYVYYDPLVTIAEPEGSSGSSSHTVLIVVLCIVGALILLACIALIIFFIWRRRRQNYEIIE